jgi:hypothetical protein
VHSFKDQTVFALTYLSDQTVIVYVVNLVTNKRNNTFDLVVTAIGIVGCGKIKIQKYSSPRAAAILWQGTIV